MVIRTMIMISDYSLKIKNKACLSVECPAQEHQCPSCRGRLRYRDTRKRILRIEGGEKRHLLVRRFRCQTCRHYHTELPDCVVPYKHYAAEVICGVLDEVVSPDDLDSETFPSAMTMLRWLKWFLANVQNMEGYLRRAMRLLHRSVPDSSLLAWLKSHTRRWLETVLRVIYNSGGFLEPLRS